MIKNLLLGALCFSGTLGFSAIQMEKGEEITNVDMAASHKNIYYDEDVSSNKLENYFKDKYSDFIGYSQIYSERKIVQNVRNYSQSQLNNHYNEVKNRTESDDMIDGTCTIVSCLGMINYFGNIRGEFSLDSDYNDVFVKIFDVCLANGYVTIKGGTEKEDDDDCLSLSFSTYGSTRTGNSNWWLLENNIKDAVNGNTPVMLSLTNHSVVVVGKTKYSVSYKKTYTTGMWWWKETVTEIVTEDEEFVIVNDGWGSSSYSGLIPFSKITNITDGMQVIWAEL